MVPPVPAAQRRLDMLEYELRRDLREAILVQNQRLDQIERDIRQALHNAELSRQTLASMHDELGQKVSVLIALGEAHCKASHRLWPTWSLWAIGVGFIVLIFALVGMRLLTPEQGKVLLNVIPKT